MADKKTTLFEFHMHGDAQFGPKSMGGMPGDEEMDVEMDEEGGEETEMTDEESAGGSRIPKMVMALVALAAISVAVRKIKSMKSGSDAGSIEVETENPTASA